LPLFGLQDGFVHTAGDIEIWQGLFGNKGLAFEKCFFSASGYHISFDCAGMRVTNHIL
jgi:hypothetical protein